MRRGWWTGRGLCLTVIVLLGGLVPVKAAEVDGRTFQVLVDNKRAGQYHLTISPQNDGTVVVNGQAEVRVTYLGVTAYHYWYRGTEVWKDHQLVRLDSSADDDGKRFNVNAQAQSDGVHVKANGQETAVAREIWTSSCWSLPDAQHRNGPVPMLDVDTGRPINATLQYVGPARVKVAGQVLDCAHFRVTGGLQLELWYDAQERLIRQESMEEGHRTTLELVGH